MSGETAVGARVEAVFTLRGGAPEQVADRAGAILDRLQEIAVGCDGECDLEVSLDVQAADGSQAGATPPR